MNQQRSIGPAGTVVSGTPRERSRERRGRLGALPLVSVAVLLGGCVSVKAPEEPIVIELNINIKQEVVYRLAEDAGNTIERNPEIF
jgi:hypothetical protein